MTVPTILARVNVGGPTIAATDGPAWLGDTQTATPNRVVDGSISTWPNAPAHGAGATLPSYVPMAVFNSQRAYPASAQTDWQFSVPAGTTLNVNLFVAQRGFDNGTNAATPSQFQVVVNGVTQPTVFDTNVSPGYNTAGELPPISVTSPASQVVTIGFTNVNGAASVNAIELVRTGGTASTYGFGKRSFNGTTLGTLSTVGQTDKTPFTTAHGAFAAGNKLFYALPDNNIYMRTFDGGNLGDALYVNPYTDPKWDVVNTGSTTSPSTPTYAGIKPTFYAEIPFLKSMFYVNGKLYYTRSDSTHLYWRWFTPDSGVIGADKFTVPGTSSFTGASGVLLVQSSKIYFSKTDGKLYTLAWNGTTVSGTPTAVAGISGLNVAAAFLGP